MPVYLSLHVRAALILSKAEGFHNCATINGATGFVSVENSGHGGAGVAASWACAEKAVDST